MLGVFVVGDTTVSPGVDRQALVTNARSTRLSVTRRENVRTSSNTGEGERSSGLDLDLGPVRGEGPAEIPRTSERFRARVGEHDLAGAQLLAVRQ